MQSSKWIEAITGDSVKQLVRDYGAAIFLATLVAVSIRFFVIEAYRIPSQAMRPTLEPGDTIFVSKSSYGIRNPFSGKKFLFNSLPSYGEVVVFSGKDDPERDFIKRVVGLPGDRIRFDKGKLEWNGQAVTQEIEAKDHSPLCGIETIGKNEAVASFEVCREPPLLDDFPETLVPEGSVFVVGDLRTQAIENRAMRNWGLIPIESLKGRALWVWLSIELPGSGQDPSWFSRIRFERMFRGIH